MSRRSNSILVPVGYALFLALNSFVLWDFPSFTGFSLLPQSSHWPLTLSCFLSNALGFFVFATGSIYKFKFFTERLFLKSSILACSGFLLLLLCAYAALDATILWILVGLLIGLGSTCIFLCWTQVLQANPLIKAKQYLLIAAVLISVIRFPFSLVPSGYLLLFVGLILLPAALLSLLFCAKRSSSENPDSATQKGAASTVKSLLKHLWVALLCISIVSIINPMVLTVAAVTSSSSSLLMGLNLVGSVVAVIVLGLSWFVLKKTVSISNVYFGITPVLASALLLFPFLDASTYSALLNFLGGIAVCMVSVIMVTASLEIARSVRLSAVTIVGILAGAMYLMRIFGVLFGGMITTITQVPQSQFAAQAFLLLYLLSLAGFLILSLSRRSAKKNSTKTENASAGHPDRRFQSDDLLVMRCEAVAQKYELSARTQQVMELLMRGRSVPAIATTLFLSQSTIQSHTKKL